MGITFFADLVAPWSLPEILHCGYSITHLPKQLWRSFSPKFSSCNHINTSAREVYLLEAGGESSASGIWLVCLCFQWVLLSSLGFNLWNMKYFSFWGCDSLFFFLFFPKERLKWECQSAGFSPWLEAKPSLFHFVPPVFLWLLQCRAAECVSSVLLLKSFMKKAGCVILFPDP